MTDYGKHRAQTNLTLSLCKLIRYEKNIRPMSFSELPWPTAFEVWVGFLSLSAIDILGWIVVMVVVDMCTCAFSALWDVEQYPWLVPTLDASSTAHPPNISLDIANVTWRGR